MFQVNETRAKMQEHGKDLADVVGAITFSPDSALTTLFDVGQRGKWKAASFQDSNVKGNALQGSFICARDGEPEVFGQGGSSGASQEFDEVMGNCNLLSWKAFDQLVPSKKSWIVSSLFAFQDFSREEVEEALSNNAPDSFGEDEIAAIVAFVFDVTQAYTSLLETVSYIDEEVWREKKQSKKTSKSQSSEEKEAALKEALSSLSLV